MHELGRGLLGGSPRATAPYLGPRPGTIDRPILGTRREGITGYTARVLKFAGGVEDHLRWQPEHANGDDKPMRMTQESWHASCQMRKPRARLANSEAWTPVDQSRIG